MTSDLPSEIAARVSGHKAIRSSLSEAEQVDFHGFVQEVVAEALEGAAPAPAPGEWQDDTPSSRVRAAQAQIESIVVAHMVVDFHTTFRSVYPTSIMASPLCAVGPLHAMIGLAIQRGTLALPAAPSPPNGGTK